MFVLVFLLCILSIPRVLPKPTVDNSELGSKLEDDETRTKRHLKFLDLLHQAIEKYASMADIKLEPLKTLADYKQYETFTYPDGSSQPLVGATNLNPNKPNVTCRKINLCSIQQPTQLSTEYKTNSPYLGQPHESNTYIAKQNQPSKIPSDTNNYSKTPSRASNPYKFSDIPAKFLSSLTQHNVGKYNFTYLPLNLATLTRFLYGPTIPSKKTDIVSSVQNTTGTATHTGSEVGSNAYPSNECICSKVFKEKSKVYKNAKEAVLGEKIRNCPCLEATNPIQYEDLVLKNKKENEYSQKPKTETYNSLVSKSENSLSSNEYEMATPPQWNDNLDLLLSKLEIVARKGNKEDLKEILRKLKTLKSEIEVTEWNYDSKEANSKNVHASKAYERDNIQLSKESKKEYDASITTTIDDEYHHEFKTIPVNEGYKSYVSSYKKPIVTTTASYKEIENIYYIKNNKKYPYNTHTTPHYNSNIKDTYSNEDISDESLETVTNSPAFEINIKNPKYYLKNDKEMNDFISSISPKSKTKDYEHHYEQHNDKINDNKKTIPNKNYYKTNTKNISPATSKTVVKKPSSGNSSDSKATKVIKNDSKITISISTNGRFKKIQVEQQLPEPNGKYLEINEKENMNMGPSSKKRPIDMMGTDSRYVKVLKQPQKSVSYPEPILSEIYPAKSKRKIEKPVIFYLNKIEEKPLNKKTNSNDFLKTFESVEYDDHKSNNEEKKKIDYEDQADQDGVFT